MGKYASARRFTPIYVVFTVLSLRQLESGVSNSNKDGLDGKDRPRRRIRTSQFSFPVATCNEVYATSGYSASVRNMAAISLATDKCVQ